MHKCGARRNPGLFVFAAIFVGRSATGARLPNKGWLFGNLMLARRGIIECGKLIRQLDFRIGRNCRMLENIRQFDPNSIQNNRIKTNYSTFSKLPVDPL